MLVTKTEFIVPNRLEWLAMLVMIGLFGFAAQVREILFCRYMIEVLVVDSPDHGPSS